jgi:hypothetical protein
MSVPVTLENCKYVYIGGREAVERPDQDQVVNQGNKPPDLANQPHFLGRSRAKCPDLVHIQKL